VFEHIPRSRPVSVEYFLSVAITPILPFFSVVACSGVESAPLGELLPCSHLSLSKIFWRNYVVACAPSFFHVEILELFCENLFFG